MWLCLSRHLLSCTALTHKMRAIIDCWHTYSSKCPFHLIIQTIHSIHACTSLKVHKAPLWWELSLFPPTGWTNRLRVMWQVLTSTRSYQSFFGIIMQCAWENHLSWEVTLLALEPPELKISKIPDCWDSQNHQSPNTASFPHNTFPLSTTSWRILCLCCNSFLISMSSFTCCLTSSCPSE